MIAWRQIAVLALGATLTLAACIARPTVTSSPPITQSSPPASTSGCANPPPDLATIVAIDPADRLACYGGASLTFAAVVGRPITDCGMGPRIESSGFCLPGVVLMAPNADASTPGLGAYWNTASGLKATALPVARGTSVQVIGHFDDPTAQMCHLSVGPSGLQTQAATDVVLGCREEFILDAIH